MLMQVRSWMPSTLTDCGCIFAVFSLRFSDSVQLDVSPSGLQVAWCCRFFADTNAGGAGTTRDSNSLVGPAHVAKLVRSVVWTYHIASPSITHRLHHH